MRLSIFHLALGLAAIFAGIAGLAASPALAVCPGATHSGTNYSGQDLKDRNFSNQNLTGANFTEAQLQGANFTGATLTGADFTRAQIGVSASNRATSFSGANLTNACFNTATIVRVDLQFANLPCTVFDGTDLSLALFGPVIKAAPPAGACRTSFNNAVMNCEFIPQWKDLEMNRASVQACYDRLQGADFSDARMEGVIFSGLNLNQTKWERARLMGAYFLNAKLRGAAFSAADLRRAQLSQADATDAKFDQQVQLSGAHLSGAILKGANLNGAVLQGSTGLPAADLSLVFMPDAVLTDAKMTGVNLSHANFYGASAKADNATMQQVDFSNANLGSVNLAQGRLKGVKMDAADLVNAVLTGADLTATPDQIASSLVQGNLQGADFTAAKLGGANLSNAAVSLTDGVVLFKAPASLTADLDRKELTAEVVTAFTSKGYHLVECQNPQVVIDQSGSKWQIWLESSVGPSSPPNSRYNKFALATISGNQIQVKGLSPGDPNKALFTVSKDYAATLDKKLLASGLLAAFRTNLYPLPPCGNPSIDVKTAGSRWKLGESLTLVTVASLGYTGFNLILEGSEIQTYGSEVTVIRPDTGGGLTLVPITLKPTQLVADAFDDNTTCPNQKSYGANKQSGTSWKDMMTAVSPPPPPPCIPSPTSWCQ
jgi:uncharacterized protein YjbI with pentapeptide repeats